MLSKLHPARTVRSICSQLDCTRLCSLRFAAICETAAPAAERNGWSPPEYPRISKELAEWFVEKGISLLGVEGPSVADVNDLPEVTEIHQILLGAKITIVESLKNLHLIEQDRIEFIALPLKLKDGDGSPVRALAIIDH